MQAEYPEGVSSEIGKFREPTVSSQPEGKRAASKSASTTQPCGVEDLKHVWKLHAREPRGPAGLRSRKASGAVVEKR